MQKNKTIETPDIVGWRKKVDISFLKKKCQLSYTRLETESREYLFIYLFIKVSQNNKHLQLKR